MPDKPGVYVFAKHTNERLCPIYVGHTDTLKERLSNPCVLVSYIGYAGVAVNIIVAIFSQHRLRHRHAENRVEASKSPERPGAPEPVYAYVTPIAYAITSVTTTALFAWGSSLCLEGCT